MTEHSALTNAAAESSVVTDHSESMLFDRCKHIATAPEIMSLVDQRLREFGDLDVKERKLLWLSAHTRWWKPCVNVGVFGPPASGKTTMIDQVIPFFPKNVFEIITSLSPKALGYDKTPYKNRYIYLKEYGGLDGPDGNDQLRSLIWDGHLSAKRVNKSKGGANAVENFTIEGPTGFFMTTTKEAIHPENQSRMLSIHVEATEDRIGQILAAQGKAAENPGATTKVDFSDFHFFEQWLAIRNKEVAIPFWSTLTGMLFKRNPQMTRYAKITEQLVKSAALIHQLSRKEDNGCIQATVEDYAAVYELVNEVIAIGLSAAVPDDVLAAYNAVVSIEDARPEAKNGVRPMWVGQKLGIMGASLTRLFKVVENYGFIRNARPFSNKLDFVVADQPPPEPQRVMPTPDQLRDALAGKTEKLENVDRAA